MIMLKIKSLTLLLLVPFLAVPVALAQEKLTKTFTSADGTFAFNYPENWQFGTLDQDTIVGSNSPAKQFDSPDTVRLLIFLPTTSVQSRFMGLGSTPVELVQAQLKQAQLFLGIVSALNDGQRTPTPGVDVAVAEFKINNRAAARVTFIAGSERTGARIAVMFIGLDVGGGYLVLIRADSPKGFAEALPHYDQIILAIATSVQYAPPKPLRSPNPELPGVFSGPLGTNGIRGDIMFYYPDGWEVVSAGGPVILNTPQEASSLVLMPGQMQAWMVDPVANMIKFDSSQNALNCKIDTKKITAMSVAQKPWIATREQIERADRGEIAYTQPAAITIKAKEAALRRMVDRNIEGLLITVDLGSGNVVSLAAYTPLGEMWKYEKQLIAIVGTLQYKPPPCPPTTK